MFGVAPQPFVGLTEKCFNFEISTPFLLQQSCNRKHHQSYSSNPILVQKKLALHYMRLLAAPRTAPETAPIFAVIKDVIATD
jgi:hypothetical protein